MYAGMCRHVEVNGHEFPFSRGASFYELNADGQIVYGRDLVEPALKPGSSALLVSLFGTGNEKRCRGHAR